MVDKIWDGSAGNNWADADNWTSSGTPFLSDVAKITEAGTIATPVVLNTMPAESTGWISTTPTRSTSLPAVRCKRAP